MTFALLCLDMNLQGSFGSTFASNSTLIFLAPFFLFYVLKDRKMPLTNYVKTYVVYLLYIALISLIYTIYLIVKNKSFYVFDENHRIFRNFTRISPSHKAQMGIYTFCQAKPHKGQCGCHRGTNLFLKTGMWGDFYG